jgi:DNA adenine methylase
MSAHVTQEVCSPFLRWVGGKRWFVRRFLDVVPTQFGRYFEPFLGSGALFFALQPERATLSDLNFELIETFSAVRRNWKAVSLALSTYNQLHSVDFYYRMRGLRARSQVERAAKFIYLNRTCWNGLYRVNVKGQFNVPIGTRDSILLESDDFCRTSSLLKRASIVSSDFEPVISRARRGDLIFADPPYVTAHLQNGFLKYNERLFSWDDQVRLMNCLRKAKARGVHVLATNADTRPIRRLYQKSFRIRTTTRTSAVAASMANRGTTTELVITSW